MLNVRLSDRPAFVAPRVLVLPVAPGEGDRPTMLVPTALPIDDELRAEIDALLVDAEHTGKPGALVSLPRPLRTPRRVLLAGIGSGDEKAWRTAGAAVARGSGADHALVVAMPSDEPDDRAASAVRGVAEGLWLASYKFRLTERRTPAIDAVVDTTPDDELHQVTLVVRDAAGTADALEDAHVTATATRFARDLTNMPSEEKTPAWFAGQVTTVAAGNPRLRVRVRSAAELAEQGFGGIVAVGGGSARPPRLVELTWEPERATKHVVLVGKGITFDTGGICIKPTAGMSLMRKDMGGAAAVIAATLGAASMNMAVRITALTPLAENMVSGSAFRPGDVICHYGGMTSEILNTDAEGRIVLGDVLAYAADELAPDYLIDLATLTGANAVALGKRTGAMFTDNDDLARSLDRAAMEAGEQVWRMPLPDDYRADLSSDIADIANASFAGAGAVTAALFLREFTGGSRSQWAHIDMSAPAWAGSADAELAKGATGWGVRTLLRWLDSL